MRVLVTGATGYLGGRLCLAALRSFHQVRALVRRTSSLSNLPPEVELAFGDIRDLQSLKDACHDCDAVLHSAAVVQSWLPDSTQFFNVNVEGLKNVIEAVMSTPSVTKLIYTSSFFAMGPTDNGHVADEEQTHTRKSYCTDYERSKVLADEVAREAATRGVPIIMLYPGVIYGPGELTYGNFLSNVLIEKFNWRLPGMLGSGKDKHSFSHVDDVVQGHLAALEKGRVGHRYLLTGEVASFNDVFQMAATLTNTWSSPIILPIWLLTIYGYLSILWATATGKTPFVTPPAVEVLKHRWIYSSAKAQKELGFISRPFKQGLAELLASLKDSAHITYY